MSVHRFKIISRVMPSTGKRRWLLKAYRNGEKSESTLTTRHSHAEAVEALNTLTR